MAAVLVGAKLKGEKDGAHPLPTSGKVYLVIKQVSFSAVLCMHLSVDFPGNLAVNIDIDQTRIHGVCTDDF